MKKPIKITLIVLAAIVAILLGAYAYFGGFDSIKFEVKEQGGEAMIYENVTGDYSQTPEVMDRIYKALLADSVKTTKGVGVYYDNPETVEKSKLRSEVGCIIDSDLDDAKAIELERKYQAKRFPKTQYIVTEFPNKGAMSVMIGIMKVYPAMNEYMKANGYKAAGPITEIYDMASGTITYRQEAVK